MLKLVPPVESIESRLQLVTLENPYENWRHPLTPDLFKMMIELKRLGYESYYPRGFLPIGTADFVANHHLICEKTEQGLIPRSGYRSITLARCEEYHLTFPALAAIEQDQGTEKHKLAIQNILTKAKELKTSISFGSGWTIHPEWRNHPELVNICKNISRAIKVEHQLRDRIDAEIAIAVPRVHTDTYLGELGYEPLCLEGKTLSSFKHFEIGHETVILMHRKKFTDFALSMVDRYEGLFKNRILISENSTIDSVKKAA